MNEQTDVLAQQLSQATSSNDNSTPSHSFLQYVMPRALTTSMVVTSTALSSIYIRGDRLILPFYLYSSTSFLLGGLYFGGVYTMKNIIRENSTDDDPINYIVPASVISASYVGIQSGIKKGVIAGLAGGILGGCYCYGSNWLYQKSRNFYVNYRKDFVENSRERKLIVMGTRWGPPETRTIRNFKLFPSSTSLEDQSTIEPKKCEEITKKPQQPEK
jgi:hypothetical protein